MHSTLVVPVLLLLLTLAVLPPSLAVQYCPLLGPTFPKPLNLSTNDLIRSAATLLSSSIEEGLHPYIGQDSVLGNVTDTLDSTSFSTRIFSVHDNAPIFEHHHTARRLDVSAGGTTRVTADTVFRIGSVSKVLTVYALLLQGRRVSWDDPVSAYIPELMMTEGVDEVQSVQWGEVTVGALASHMAGIGRDFNLADLAAQNFPWTEYGLPALAPSDVPACAGKEEQQPCSRE
ncbi:MAG: hypothetical protein M1830_004312, partial [Pleopsidium flavum]